MNAPSRNAALETRESNLVQPENLSVQQLERLLAQCRFHEEQNYLGEKEANTNAITATKENPKAVGSTVYLPVKICGVSVEVMVDTGAQSTIILCWNYNILHYLFIRTL